MKDEQQIKPDYIFEVSWEVCNKVGGIHTVISSKALTLVSEWEDKLIMIGPDIWKGSGNNPEFTEDTELFKSWRHNIESSGLKIKIGRWNITGNPIVILVDFTILFNEKNKIFEDLWKRFKVDSLPGHWDYIEPVLFGYAAGKIIECFYNCYLTFSDKIVAQFHEWMTGSGILYLEEYVPQIATIFTTHATAVGRSIAGNGLPLYSRFEYYNGDDEAKKFNIVSKHSIEKQSAKYADCFTTVSEITSKECERFLEKKPDIITPNGFEDSFVPDPFLLKQKRISARKKLIQVAETLLRKKLPQDVILILKSGRYEFHNKGIDLFIDAMDLLKKEKDLSKEFVGFIFVPAHQTGPRKELQESKQQIHNSTQFGDNILTHHLQGIESDPIMERIKNSELYNSSNDKVNIIFAPTYLDGNDGIFNMNYYDLLAGFDISAFPSYYEPWGYTPLESLSFHVPTITTNLTGFGMLLQNSNHGITIIPRNDNNDSEVVKQITSTILNFSKKTEEEIKTARDAAYRLSRLALWKNLILNYKQAYSIALKKTKEREDKFIHKPKIEEWDAKTKAESSKTNAPVWKKIFITSELPEKLQGLKKLAMNLWWTWNNDAKELFETIAPELWEKKEYNPLALIENLPLEKLNQLENDIVFVEKLKNVVQLFEDYVNKSEINKSYQVAYFCMEYGLHSSLKLYSGGLGVLAGDYLKEASDANTNMVAVGLLYRKGYFKQKLSQRGDQIADDDIQKFTELPIHPIRNEDGDWIKVTIPFPGRTLYAKAWKIYVGRISLYMLDTDIPENTKEDRNITAQLYGDGLENRLQQEILLGIGGARLLNILGYKPDVYHCNEGHAAFVGLERIYRLMTEENISFDEAVEFVRASSLFTTHTPVAAGHDLFDEDSLRKYFSHYPGLFDISWKKLYGFGSSDNHSTKEEFSMSILAAKLAQEINGVSEIHQKITRKILNKLWEGYASEELNIGHVTNGVHLPTWMSDRWQKLFEKKLGKDFRTNVTSNELWKKVTEIPDQEIWDVHQESKNRLINYIKEKVNISSGKYYTAEENKKNLDYLKENTLIIGFGRRFVTYKRAEILFHNLETLSEIVNNPNKPVVIIFSGKAHPNDYEGRKIIKNILSISQKQNFSGKIIFLENYNMFLAELLTQGADLWLNTPTPGLEASGTSGMKASLNGVLNFSSIDGWWAEAFNNKNGWAIPSIPIKNHVSMYELDADNIYYILKNEIISSYFKKDENNVPLQWVKMIKNAFESIVPTYTTKRVILEYNEKYYKRLFERQKELGSNHYEKSKLIASWKHKIIKSWNGIKIISTSVNDTTNKSFTLGQNLDTNVKLNINGLQPEDIGVEIIFIKKRMREDETEKIIFKEELLYQKKDKQTEYVEFSKTIPMTHTGVYEYGFRVFPKNELCQNRQDLSIVKWLK